MKSSGVARRVGWVGRGRRKGVCWRVACWSLGGEVDEEEGGLVGGNSPKIVA
jgi:hypothetical protein